MSEKQLPPVRPGALPAWVTKGGGGGDYPRWRVVDGRSVPCVVDGRPVLTAAEYRLWWELVENFDDDLVNGLVDGEQKALALVACLSYPLRLGLMYFAMGSEEGHYLPYVL